ncbi:hypothetical protein Pcinc_014358 [Petrolisthes cinctipes]|uniref:Uncharacterized protein n=1 Tax=Petrolisthes cinctipes TaxID=88211 RepID=A0AAE1FV83_PETCI|nr:hypothetical protein Pcinc_014358 [Petrolisthes cinctipes]
MLTDTCYLCHLTIMLLEAAILLQPVVTSPSCCWRPPYCFTLLSPHHHVAGGRHIASPCCHLTIMLLEAAILLHPVVSCCMARLIPVEVWEEQEYSPEGQPYYEMPPSAPCTPYPREGTNVVMHVCVVTVMVLMVAGMVLSFPPHHELQDTSKLPTGLTDLEDEHLSRQKRGCVTCGGGGGGGCGGGGCHDSRESSGYRDSFENGNGCGGGGCGYSDSYESGCVGGGCGGGCVGGGCGGGGTASAHSSAYSSSSSGRWRRSLKKQQEKK